MRLYKVTIRGRTNPMLTNYRTSYVVAKNLSSAYQQVRSFLEKNALCSEDSRELQSVELVVEL